MDIVMYILFGLAGIGAFGLWLLPAYLAIKRQHQFKWVITALAVTSPFFFGVTWLLALFWVLWPSNKTIVDPIISTADESRNLGDALSTVTTKFKSQDKSRKSLESKLEEIERLHRDQKISEEERRLLREKAISEN